MIITNANTKPFFAISHARDAFAEEAGSDLDLFLGLAGAEYNVTAEQAINPISGLPVPNQFFLIRDSDQEVVAPKTVTESYGIITPTDLANSVRGLVESGWATASDFMMLKKEGIVGMGEILAFRLDTARNIAGEDDWNWYILLQNMHGRGKVRARIACYRPTGKNQMGGLMADFNWSVSHRVARGQRSVTANRVDAAAKQWDELNKRIDMIANRLDDFARTPLSNPISVANAILDIDDGDDDDDIPTKRLNMRSAIMDEYYNPGRGTHGRTAYDMLMAVTAVNSHGSPHINSKKSVSARQAGIVDGPEHRREIKAVQVLSNLP